MQIIVTGHQVAVTPALHDYVVQKLERVVRHFDHLHDAAVTLSVEKLLQRAEATIHCGGNKIIHADAQAADMYAAIDTLADKLDRQVKKHKEKVTDHHREDGREARYS
jgi:putative sigma-54 modulation protein